MHGKYGKKTNRETDDEMSAVDALMGDDGEEMEESEEVNPVSAKLEKARALLDEIEGLL